MTDRRSCQCPTCGQTLSPTHGIVVDLDRNRVTCWAGSVALSPIEAEILSVIVGRYPKAASPDLIIASVWPLEPAHRRTVNVHVSNIRKKTTRMPFGIKGIWGRGFVLDP
jgi:DNA-binding response OmpR family regulator